MARLARVVIPDLPHHVTQRGNGRQKVFFTDEDYRLYRDMLASAASANDVAVLGWCLMPNHVHLILVPKDADGLRRMLAPLHRRYAGNIHARQKRTGHFWQGRFGCVAMDEAHLGTALGYVMLNPVRARLVKRARDWPWSCTRALLGLEEDTLTAVDRVRSIWPDIVGMLEAKPDKVAFKTLRMAESVGRPIGDAAFMEAVEKATGRNLAPGKRGPKKQDEAQAQA
jgi:putative transposase